MNERINELEQQCWGHRVDGVLVDGQLHFDTKKFAELIVRECDRYARSAWEHGPLLGKDLLIHFGVEE
jgi:hypothetical protein